MSVGLFLNLPNNESVMRRYMCSYFSPTFLFQPIELLSLAAVYRERGYGSPILLDAIAEKKTTQDVINVIQQISPDFIISLSGFECFEEDVNEVTTIKQKFPDIPIILFGHYVTQFPDILILNTTIDYLIHGEPDVIFGELLDFIYNNKDISEVQGISYRGEKGEVIHQGKNNRIPNPNELPMPAFELLKNHYYTEPFFPKPYGLIQSARGCPYQCNYCVKSFGTKLTMLTPENIILQIDAYRDLFGIKAFRFIDDTFTAVPNRVIEFCKLLIEKNYNLKWSCLTRPDTLDPVMLNWMKKAGCVRLYIGVESASYKILEYYNKKFDIDLSLNSIREAKKMGFELMAFFMVGSPIETIEDVKQSLRFALNAGFDFITVSKISPYPGTELFNKLRDDIDFSALPYRNRFKDENIELRGYKFQRYFLRNFYFNYKTILNLLSKPRWYMTQLPQNIKSFLSFLLKDTSQKDRNDFI